MASHLHTWGAVAFATVQQWQVWGWWMICNTGILAQPLELQRMGLDSIGYDHMLGTLGCSGIFATAVSVKWWRTFLRCNEIEGFCDTAERRLAAVEAVGCGSFWTFFWNAGFLMMFWWLWGSQPVAFFLCRHLPSLSGHRVNLSQIWKWLRIRSNRQKWNMKLYVISCIIFNIYLYNIYYRDSVRRLVPVSPWISWKFCIWTWCWTGQDHTCANLKGTETPKVGRQQPVEVIFSLWQGLCCYCHWNFPATSFFWVRSKDGAYMMNRGNSLHLLQYLYKLPGSSWRTCWYQKIVRCLADLNHTWSFQAVSFSIFSTCYILQTLATSITFMDDSTLVQTKPWVTMSRRFDLAQVSVSRCWNHSCR